MNCRTGNENENGKGTGLLQKVPLCLCVQHLYGVDRTALLSTQAGEYLLQQPLSFGRRERKASVDNFLRSV
jgi:hypothetical protein